RLIGHGLQTEDQPSRDESLRVIHAVEVLDLVHRGVDLIGDDVQPAVLLRDEPAPDQMLVEALREATPERSRRRVEENARAQAPSWAASITPGPAPVTTIQPRATISRANSRAARYSGSEAPERAEPKIVTFRSCRYGANTRKA